MFLAVIAFTLSSFRHYIMFNHQNLVEDDNEDDDEIFLASLSSHQRSVQLVNHQLILNRKEKQVNMHYANVFMNLNAHLKNLNGKRNKYF